MTLGRKCGPKLVGPLGPRSYAPRSFLRPRTFHTTSRLSIVRPFLLSDIGEGRWTLSDWYPSLAQSNRYQGGTNHTMVRPTRSTR